ncbi:MAG: phosphoribosylglycinamide formyltransferase 1 [Microgenomates group bacterium Gr01-1014_93]|nr:MAG: phosphoribosylglycinamide formyltransferase 1 [Microgenomates group bacterium Gr01-1014_93]
MEKIRLAILASGAGTTGEPIFERCVIIITNNPDAGVIERAKKYGIPFEVRMRKDYQEEGSYSPKKYGEELIRILKGQNANFISQNGWAILTPSNIIVAFKDRIVNSHPAPLDPGYSDFGGAGMHGLAVHQAVLNFARAVNRPFHTEVTLHKVGEEYDKGSLLMFTPVEILPDDSAETLQERLKEVEKKQNKEFWEKVQQTKKLEVIERPNRLILPEEVEILEKAKLDAVAKYPHG